MLCSWSRGLHLSSQLPALDYGFKGLLTSGSSANTRRAPLGRPPPSCRCQQRRRVRALSEAARGSAAPGSELLAEQPDTSAAEPESLTVPEVRAGRCQADLRPLLCPESTYK